MDSGGTVVLVNQDGIQRPPLRFPQGGHLLQFLSCLENGLLPRGQLDPPLWSQRGKVSSGGNPSYTFLLLFSKKKKQVNSKAFRGAGPHKPHYCLCSLCGRDSVTVSPVTCQEKYLLWLFILRYIRLRTEMMLLCVCVCVWFFL